MKAYTNNITWGNETVYKPSAQTWAAAVTTFDIYDDNNINIQWDSYNRGKIQLKNKIDNVYYTYLEYKNEYYFLYPVQTVSKSKNYLIYEVIPDVWKNKILGKTFNRAILALTSDEKEIRYNNNLVKTITEYNSVIKYQADPITLLSKTWTFKAISPKFMYYTWIYATQPDLPGFDGSSNDHPAQGFQLDLNHITVELNKSTFLYKLNAFPDNTSLSENNWYSLGRQLSVISSNDKVGSINSQFKFPDEPWVKYKKGKPVTYKKAIYYLYNITGGITSFKLLKDDFLFHTYGDYTLQYRGFFKDVFKDYKPKHEFSFYSQHDFQLQDSANTAIFMNFKSNFNGLIKNEQIKQQGYEPWENIYTIGEDKLSEYISTPLYLLEHNIAPPFGLDELTQLAEDEYYENASRTVRLYYKDNVDNVNILNLAPDLAKNIIVCLKLNHEQIVGDAEGIEYTVRNTNTEEYKILLKNGQEINLDYGWNNIKIFVDTKDNIITLRLYLRTELRVEQLFYDFGNEFQTNLINNDDLRIKQQQTQLLNTQIWTTSENYALEEKKQKANYNWSIANSAIGLLGAPLGLLRGGGGVGNVLATQGAISGLTGGIGNIASNVNNYYYDTQIRQNQYALSMAQYNLQKQTLSAEIAKMNPQNRSLGGWYTLLKFLKLGTTPFLITKKTASDEAIRVYNEYLNNVGYPTNKNEMKSYTIEKPGVYQFLRFEESDPVDGQDIKNILTNLFIVV